MKKIIYIGVVSIFVGVLSGCNDEPKSEAWYKSHPEETFNVYKECIDSGEASQNCENARKAAISFARSGNAELENKFLPLMRK
ncbi:EexN family lipoprotein [Serratia sp. J2]|uniref:EexN family lipoprotein n=1 Tax=Serratia sp. J2 TaxID=3386551 RepID=UPI003917425F